jgi:hypothetical protein
VETKRNISSAVALLETKFYKEAVRSVGSWDSPQIEIISLDGKAIARIPHAFLTRGGHNTWEYILHVVYQLVLETGGWIYLSGAPVDVRLAPSPGLYVYAADGKMFLLGQQLLIRIRYDFLRPQKTNMRERFERV